MKNPRIVIDAARHEVKVDGRSVRLAPKEFEALSLLAQHPGVVFTREDILRKVWGIEQAQDLQTRTIDQHIARARKRLRDDGSLVVTVAGYGYKAVGIGLIKDERAKPNTFKVEEIERSFEDGRAVTWLRVSDPDGRIKRNGVLKIV